MQESRSRIRGVLRQLNQPKASICGNRNGIENRSNKTKENILKTKTEIRTYLTRKPKNIRNEEKIDFENSQRAARLAECNRTAIRQLYSTNHPPTPLLRLLSFETGATGSKFQVRIDVYELINAFVSCRLGQYRR